MYLIEEKQLTEDVAPAAEPVTLAEAKAWCRIDTSADDELVTSLVKAVRSWIEINLNISMVQRTYTARIPFFADCIQLARLPAASLQRIQYWDTASPSVLQTLFDATSSPLVQAEGVLLDADKGRVYRNSGSWPSTLCRPDAVQIQYVAGYAPAGSPQDHAANVPADLKTAVKLLVADLYRERGVTTMTEMHQLPTAQRILDMHKEYLW